CDFYEQRIDHASHYQGRIHKESGRIYRIRGKAAPRPAPPDLRAMTTVELVEQLRNPNRWVRQTASRLLAERRDDAAIPLLRTMLDSETGQTALEAFWVLARLMPLDDRMAAETLRHPDPYVRLWTIRLLCDDNELSSPL